MKNELAYFDVSPKVVPTGQRTRITIRPLSRHAAYENGKQYYVNIIPMDQRAPNQTYPVVAATLDGGVLRFEHVFEREQQYELWVCDACIPRVGNMSDWQGVRRDKLHVYALQSDLYGLRPLRGNMHTHSFRSDGVESPEIVAAWYRSVGVDFLAITDHGQYQPSLEAIQAYEGASLDMLLFPGEEVHPPQNPIHVVSFGGEHSVNALFQHDKATYRAEVAAIESGLALPPSVDPYEYASTLWVFQQIRKAGGFSILCHPNWLYEGAYNLPSDTLQHLLSHVSYDALELVNGGNTQHENQLQIAAWYNAGSAESRPSVVGNDDSHGVVNGQWFNVCHTYALANGRDQLLSALQKGLCCASERYAHEQERIYGPNRLVRYFTFLSDEYFPLHDALCFEEGRLMAAYVNGDTDARERLSRCHGQTERLWQRIVSPS